MVSILAKMLEELRPGKVFESLIDYHFELFVLQSTYLEFFHLVSKVG